MRASHIFVKTEMWDALFFMLISKRRSMSLFKEVKAAVTARQAAERYGLKVNRAGMACCPFHDDRNPSMKLDDRFYCFGCGATGDAVDLTARLLGLTSKEAALQLASDFGIRPLQNENHQKVVRVKSTQTKHERSEQKVAWAKNAQTKKVKPDRDEIWADRAIHILFDYLSLLRSWETNYAPKSMDDDDWHPLFCEALDRKSFIEYVLDELLAAGKSEYEELRHCCGKEVEKIEKRLERYARRDAVRD